MIEIITKDNKKVALYPNTQISIKFKSPHWELKSISFTKSEYSFEVPKAGNDFLLMFPEKLHAVKFCKSVDVSFKFRGLLLFEGTLFLREADEDYSVIIVDKASELLSRLQKQSLKDIDVIINSSQEEQSTYTTYPDYDYTCFPLLISEFLNTTGQHFSDYNAIGGGSFGHPTTFNLYVNAVLRFIFEMNDFFIKYNFITTNDLNKTVIVNACYVQTVVADALPDIKISDFLLSLRNSLNISYSIDSKSNTIKIVDREELLSNTNAIDISHFISKTIRIIENKFDNYIFKHKKSNCKFLAEEMDIKNIRGQFIGIVDYLPASASNYDIVHLQKDNYLYRWYQGLWHKYRYNYDCYIEKETANSLVIESNVVLLANKDDHRDPHAGTSNEYGIQIPVYDVPFEVIHDTKNNSELVLAFAHGRINSEILNTPVASSHNFFSRKHGEMGEFSLFWDGNFGLKEKRWKNWLNWMKTREKFRIEFSPDLNFIRNFSAGQKYRINQKNFLIDEMVVEFSNSGFKVSDCVGYSC